MDYKMKENAPDHLDFIRLESESNSNSCSDQLEATKNHQKAVLDRFKTLVETITEKNPRSKTEQHSPKSVSTEQAKVTGQKLEAGDETLVAIASMILETETEKEEGGRFSDCVSGSVAYDYRSDSENSNGEEGDYEEIDSWLVYSDSCSEESEYSSDSSWEESCEEDVIEMYPSCEESCVED